MAVAVAQEPGDPDARDALGLARAAAEVAEVTGYLADADVAAAIDGGTLAEHQAWRAWVLGELAFLECAATDEDRAGLELEQRWRRTFEQPPAPADPPGEAEAAILGRWRRAREHVGDRALPGVRRLLDRGALSPLAETLLLVELASAERDRGRFDVASRLLERASERLEGSDPGDVPVALEAVYLVRTLEGTLELRAGRADEAWKPTEEAHAAALAHLAATKNPVLWAESVSKLLDLAHASNDARGGRAHYDRARDRDAFETLDQLSRLRIEWRHAALPFVDPDATHEERLRAARGVEALAGTELDLPGWEAERRLLALVTIRACLRDGLPEVGENLFASYAPPEPFDVSWSPIAARLATARTAELARETGDPARIDELADQLQKAVLEEVAATSSWGDDLLGRGLLHFDEQAELLEAAIGALLEAGRKGEALDLVGRVQEAGSLARALGAEAPADPRDLVPEDGGLLVFTPGYRVDHLFVLDGDALEVVVLEDTRSLHAERRKVLRALRAAIGDESRTAEFDEAQRALAERLFASELGSALRRWNRVTVVGLEAWGDLPLELLELDGERLGSRLELDFVSSIPVAAHLASRPSRTDGPGDLVAAFVADPGDVTRAAYTECVPLGSDAALAERVLGDLEARDLLLGEEATLEAWNRALAAPPTLALVLAHGVRAVDGSRAVALHGSSPDGGLLSTGTLADGMAPRTVVLAACEGGRHLHRRGDDGRESLGSAYLVAGAGCVIASTNRLSLGAALGQGAHLVEGLLTEGRSPAAALRAGRVSDPDDLGAWTLRAHGRGHAPLTEPSAHEAGRGRTRVVALVLALVVVAGGLGLLRRRTTSGRP